MPRRGRVVTAWRSAGEEDHPLRVAVLAALDWIGEPCSPVQLAHCLEAHPATVSYHVRVLASAGTLALASTHRQRGAQERRFVRRS
jgi:Helix-turn-helix domain